MVNKILIGLVLIISQLNAVINLNDSRIDKQALFARAIDQGNIDLVKKLIKAGVNVNHKLYLSMAIYKQNIDLVKLLLNANANKIDEENGWNAPLTSAVNTDNIEIIELLINSGSDINLKDSYGRCIFHARSVQTLDLLINSGADINIIDNYGRTAIYYAIQNNNLEVAKTLIVNGARINHGVVNIDDLLKIACEVGNLEAIEFLQSL
jgi:serine/threonine-protein phosphatase 6 regulatory ankyrin repeat subunit A